MLDIPLIARIAAELREGMGDDFDEAAFLDTLDGATDATDIADWMLRKISHDEAMCRAIDMEMSDLSARKMRKGASADTMRGRLLTLLDASGLKKMERPLATVSRRSGSVSVRVTDEAAIPSQLCTVKTITTPDKAAIKRQIEAGETIPGAELVRGPDGVTVRVK
jgi:hypothetical protein